MAVTCDDCGRKISFFRFALGAGLCDLCFKKKVERLLKEEEKGKKAIEEIKKYVEHSYSLGEKSEEHYLEWNSVGLAIYPFGNAFFIDRDELINLVIKSGYNVKKVIDEFVESELVKIEVNKIKQRGRKREIKEKAEKKLYGKIKTKRKTFTTEEKEMVFDKFDNECAICGKKEGLHIHHKDKNSSNNQMNNLIILCGVCHKKIHMNVR